VRPCLAAASTAPVICTGAGYAAPIRHPVSHEGTSPATTLGAVSKKTALPAAEARRRALLAYSAYLGPGQLAHSTPAVLPATSALTSTTPFVP
jgi:hypothetical protein